MNGDSKNTTESPSLVSSLGSSCRYQRLLSCLGCSGQPRTKIGYKEDIKQDSRGTIVLDFLSNDAELDCLFHPFLDSICLKNKKGHSLKCCVIMRNILQIVCIS